MRQNERGWDEHAFYVRQGSAWIEFCERLAFREFVRRDSVPMTVRQWIAQVALQDVKSSMVRHPHLFEWPELEASVEIIATFLRPLSDFGVDAELELRARGGRAYHVRMGRA